VSARPENAATPAPGPPDLVVAGAVVTAAALLAAVAPSWSFLAIPLGIVAAGLALAGLLLPRRGRRWAAVILALALGTVVLGGLRLTSPSEASTAPSEAPAASQPPASVDPDATVVTYEIVTDGMSVTHLSYVDVIDGRLEMVEKLGVPPPFQHVIVLPADTSVDLTGLSVTGLGGSTSTMTTCTLTVDGDVVARQSAEGSYGVVSCAVPAPG
jgi:hypothetical protein